MKLEFYRQIYEKYRNTTSHETLFTEKQVVPHGQIGMSKPIFAFRNIADVPKNC